MNTLRVFIVCICIFWTHLALAQAKWQYTSFPVIGPKSVERQSERGVIRVGTSSLETLLEADSPTHPEWGVEQVYTSRDFTKRIFVKYEVTVDQARATNGAWLRLGKGSVLHLSHGKSTTAYYAIGFNTVELHEIKRLFAKKPSAASRSWRELLVPTVHAETLSATGSRGSSTTSVPIQSLPVADRIWVARSSRIAQCIGKETWAAVKSNAAALYENANWQSVKAGARHTATAAWAAVPSREDVRSGARQSWNFVKNTWNDPAQAWSEVNDRFDQSIEAVALISQEIAKSVEGFSELSSDVQDQILCHGIQYFASSQAMSAILVATGAGATVALAKLTASALRYASHIQSMMPLIRQLNGLSRLENGEKKEFVHQLLRGNLDEKKRRTLEMEVSLTQSIARSPKVRVYNNRQELTDHSIQPGNSYTVVFEGDQMLMGHQIRGYYNPKPGGAGSHLTLLGVHRKSDIPSGTEYNGGAIRFNEDGTIDISGYRRAKADRVSEEKIVRLIKELYPSARIRSTPDRMNTLD